MLRRYGVMVPGGSVLFLDPFLFPGFLSLVLGLLEQLPLAFSFAWAFPLLFFVVCQVPAGGRSCNTTKKKKGIYHLCRTHMSPLGGSGTWEVWLLLVVSQSSACGGWLDVTHCSLSCIALCTGEIRFRITWAARLFGWSACDWFLPVNIRSLSSDTKEERTGGSGLVRSSCVFLVCSCLCPWYHFWVSSYL